MKKLVLSAVLAVGLLATTNQSAKANGWFNFSVGGSAHFNLSFGAACSPCGYGCNPCGYGYCPPHPYTQFCAPGANYVSGVPVYSVGAQGMQFMAQPAAAQPAPVQPAYYAPTYQPVGYYYQAPGYWYGR